MSITQILSEAAESQLRLHLAADLASSVAQQVAESQAKAVLQELESFLTPAAPPPAPRKRGRPAASAASSNGHGHVVARTKAPARRKAAASAEAASSGAVGPGGTHSRAFTASARNTMSEKKKLYWALQRLASGRKPLPGDEDAVARSKAEGTYESLFARATNKVRAEKKAKKVAAGAGLVLASSTLSEKLAM